MKATLSVILSAILWGVISLFVKALGNLGFSEIQISLVRTMVAMLVFSISSTIRDPRILKIRLKDLWIFIGTGFLSVFLMNLSYFYTVINGQTSVATVLLYTAPAFIIVFSAVFFKERITHMKILCLILTITGCVFVSGVIGNSSKVGYDVLLSGFAAGMTYSLYSIFGKYAEKYGYHAMTTTTWTFIVAFAFSLPFSHPFATIRLLFSSFEAAAWGLGIGIIPTAGAYFFYTWGLQKMEAGKAGILVSLDLLIGTMIGIICYKEPYNPMKIIGILLVLVSVIVLNIHKSRKSEDSLR